MLVIFESPCHCLHPRSCPLTNCLPCGFAEFIDALLRLIFELEIGFEHEQIRYLQPFTIKPTFVIQVYTIT